MGLVVCADAHAGWGREGRGADAVCPGLLQGTPAENRAPVPSREDYNKALKGLSVEAVLADIVDLLTQSERCWPADKFRSSVIGQSYGGLFVRLAWHCSGSFRSTDGAGGCGGGRQRFQPESSWEDNTNLDKARALLWPVKQKYGDALSWGDLFVLAGTGAILHMGGPVTEVCVGRIDEADGSASAPLGPGAEQPPCPTPGNCPAPIGAAVVGLIYVNPEGFLGEPEPERTAGHIREIFSRMGMNDTETVALIGGGHAFGKSHGACPLGAGPTPAEQPLNPWPGNCGTGKGRDTFTSGIEGPWTTDPFKWDNEFFQLLAKYGRDYRVYRGPGGKWQWRIPQRPDLMMLTTDVALTYDGNYNSIVGAFAEDLGYLDAHFAAAWEKLTTNGGFWAEEAKCWKADGRFTAPELLEKTTPTGQR